MFFTGYDVLFLIIHGYVAHLINADIRVHMCLLQFALKAQACVNCVVNFRNIFVAPTYVNVILSETKHVSAIAHSFQTR